VLRPQSERTRRPRRNRTAARWRLGGWFEVCVTVTNRSAYKVSPRTSLRAGGTYERGRAAKGHSFEPPVSLRVTPRRRENGVGLPADADVFLGA
jgi:hypothetical protein